VSIYIVRHGETAGNAARVFQVPDTPLSERGLAQARRLGARLSALDVGLVLASDLARARMTAEVVQAATGAPLELDSGLQERNFGDLRGRPYAELELDPFAPGYTPPAGESWEELHARVDAAWLRVVAAAERIRGELVVVTHGLVCHSLVTRRLLRGEGVDPPAGFGNTAVTIVDALPPHRIQLLGCIAHLDDETANDLGARSGA
jgi:broad specificity phosphatase PhoE